MARGFKRAHNLTKATLLTIAKAGLIAIALSGSPYALNSAARKFFKDRTRKAIYARARKLREMERRKLVRFEDSPNGDVRIELTRHGEHLVRQYNLEMMHLKKSPRWDGEWRVVMYDIPQSQRKASNAFREKIRAMGLYPFQRSVWISPCDCEAELEFLCSVFDISMDDCVYHFRAKRIPREQEIKKFFGIQA